MENTSQKHRSQSVESGSAELSSPSQIHRTQQIAHTPNSFSPSADRADTEYQSNKRKASTSSDGRLLRSPSIPTSDPHDHKRLKNLDNTSPIRSKSPSSVHSGSSGIAQTQNSRSTQVLENLDAQAPRDSTRVSSEGASLPRINSEYKESSETVTSPDQVLGQRGVSDYSAGLRNSPQPTLPLPSFRLPSMSSSFPSIHSRTTSPPSLQSPSGSFSYSANSMSPSGSTGGSVLASTYEGQGSSPSPKPSFPPIRSISQYSREVPILPPISAPNLDSGKPIFATKPMSVSSILSSNNISEEAEVLGGSREYEERKPIDFHQQYPLDQLPPVLKVEDQGSGIIGQNHSNVSNGAQLQTVEPKLRTVEATNAEPNIPQAKYPEVETASEEEEEIMETGGVVNRDQSVVSSRGETPLSVAEPPEEPVFRSKPRKKAMDSENGAGNTPQLIIRNNKLYDVMKSEDFHLGYTVYSPFTTLPILEGKENGLLEVRVPGIYLSFSNSKVRKQAVWGTDVYTDDSDVVTALIHSGFYTPPMPTLTNGDLKSAMKNIEALPHANHDLSVTIRVMPKLIKYASTVRYRIKSREWGDHDGVSFKIESVKVLKFGEALRKGRKQRKDFIKANELMRQRVMNCVMTNNPHFIYTGLYETSVSIMFNQNNVPCYKYHPNLILALQQEDAEEAPVWNLDRFKQDILCLENTKHSYHLARVPKSESNEGGTLEHYRLKIHAPNTIDFTFETDFVSLQWSDIVWTERGVLITSKCEPDQIEMLKGKTIPEGVLIPINFVYWITPEIIDRIKTARLEKERAQKEPSPIVPEPETSVPSVIEPEVEDKSSTPDNSEPTIESKDTSKLESAPVESKAELSSDQAEAKPEITSVSTEIEEDSVVTEVMDTNDTIKEVVMTDSAVVTDEVEIPPISLIEETTKSSEQKEDSSIQSENAESHLPTVPENQEVSISEDNVEEKIEEADAVEKPEQRKLQDNVEIVIKQSAKPMVDVVPDAHSVDAVECAVIEGTTEPMEITESNETIESTSEILQDKTQDPDSTGVQVETETAMQVDVEIQNDLVDSEENKPDDPAPEVEEGEIDSEVCESNVDLEKEVQPEVLEVEPQVEEKLDAEPEESPIPAEQISHGNDSGLLDEVKDPLPELVPSQKTEGESNLDVSSNTTDVSEKAHSPSDELPTDNESQQAVKESVEAPELEEKVTLTTPPKTEVVDDPVSESNDVATQDKVEDEKIEEGEIPSLSEENAAPENEEEKIPETRSSREDLQSESGKKDESRESLEELEAGEISPEAMDVDPVLTSESKANENVTESSINEINEQANSKDDQESKDASAIEGIEDVHRSEDISKSPETEETNLSGHSQKESGELEANNSTTQSPKSKDDSDMEEGEIDDDDEDGVISDPRSSVRPTQSTYRGSDYKYKTDDFRKAGLKDPKPKDKGDKPYGFYDRPERFKERFDYRRDDRKFDRGRDRAEEYKPYRREDRPRDRARYERRDDIPGVRPRNERYDRFGKTHERPGEFKEDRNRFEKDFPESSKPHSSVSSDNEEGELTDQPSPSAGDTSQPAMDKDDSKLSRQESSGE